MDNHEIAALLVPIIGSLTVYSGYLIGIGVRRRVLLRKAKKSNFVGPEGFEFRVNGTEEWHKESRKAKLCILIPIFIWLSIGAYIAYVWLEYPLRYHKYESLTSDIFSLGMIYFFIIAIMAIGFFKAILGIDIHPEEEKKKEESDIQTLNLR